MRWGVFIVAAILLTVLEMTLTPALEIAGMRPSLMAVLGLYIALWAPRLTALWGCLLLGLLVDLPKPWTYPPSESLHLLGPNALGFVFACALTLQIRSMVMRRQVIAVAFLSVVFAVAANIVVVAIFTVRSFYAAEFAQFSPAGTLLLRLGAAVYTGIVAVPLAWILLRLNAAWGFHTSSTGRTNWR